MSTCFAPLASCVHASIDPSDNTTAGAFAEFQLKGTRELGRCYLGQQRWADAAPHFERYLTGRNSVRRVEAIRLLKERCPVCFFPSAESTAALWLPWTCFQAAVAYAALGRDEDVKRVMALLREQEIPEMRAFSQCAEQRCIEFHDAGERCVRLRSCRSVFGISAVVR